MKRILAAVFLSLAMAHPAVSTERVHTSYPSEHGPNGKLTVSVEPGEEWVHKFRVALVVGIETEPQMAFWLESEDGRFVSTIYVTERTATQSWRGSPGEKRSEIERPYALPVWKKAHAGMGIAPMSSCSACHNRHREGYEPPDEDADLDAVSGATPPWGFTREWPVPEKLEPGTYVVKAEINQSKDNNDAYPEDAKPGDDNYSGGKMGSGQPSLIYAGTLEIGVEHSTVRLEPVGHGHPAGADGSMNPDLSTLTTASKIVASIDVSYEPVP